VKEQIRQHAIELGFDDCRVTSAEAPESAARFEDWLNRGCHGEMQYLSRNAPKRVDPQLVLSGARSILTLAVSYHPPMTAPEAGAPHKSPSQEASGSTGVVARYARFADYHDVIGELLQKLAGYLREVGGPEVRSLWYVDTGPLLERDLAQRSGLGFVGKHTNLISRRLGNWFFLAEVLTTLELEPDVSERNRCGTCVRCIQACPTAAITAPFQLDARRCISYLTIELKGSIPVPLRSLIGQRIYGCDDCLEVCPWNRFAAEGRLMNRHQRHDLTQPDLLDLLRLDEPGFKARFAHTPILRTKRRGLLRNVCVALGNIGSPEALPDLDRATHDLEPLIAEHAAWAINAIEERRSGSGN
jgi:epoxyqueuosine reductase